MTSKTHDESVKYIYDLPYFVRKNLCTILNQYDKWEELAGKS